MKQVTGNLFDYATSHWLVITTNLGWNKRGENVMGAGLALQAKTRYPDLPRLYGEFCQHRRVQLAFFPQYRLIMFPTKTLNPDEPHLSWKQNSSLGLIEQCLPELQRFAENPPDAPAPIMVPLLGCSNGGLDPKVVVPLMERYLVSDKFTLIRPGSTTVDY